MNYRKEQLFLEIEKRTELALKHNSWNKLNTDAYTLSIDLCMQRSNISSSLNIGFKNGLYVKIKGRPTFYLLKSKMEQFYSDVYIPSFFPSMQGFFNYFERVLQKKQDSSNMIIGSSNLESMYQLYLYSHSIISKTKSKHPLKIIITGDIGCGKSYFLNVNFELFSNNSNITSSYYDCRDYHSFSSFLDHIKKETSSILIIDNFHYLLEKESIYYIANSLNKINNSLILIGRNISSIKYELKDYHFFDIPNYKKRTSKEKFEFVFYFLYKQAIELKEVLVIDKNVLTSLAMANYDDNLHGLFREIRSCCLKANFSNKDIIKPHIRIQLENISNEIFTSIESTASIRNEIEKIYSFFDETYFIIDPSEDYKYLNILLKARLTMTKNIKSPAEDTGNENALNDFYSAIENEYEIKSLPAKLQYSSLFFKEYPDAPVSLSYTLNYKITEFFNKSNAKYNPKINYKNTLIKNKTISLFIEELENRNNKYFDIYQLSYINKFITLTIEYLSNDNYQVLFVSQWSKIAKLYNDYLSIRVRDTKIITNYLDLSLSLINVNSVELKNNITAKIKNNSRKKGIVCISDGIITEAFQMLLRDIIDENVYFLQNINIGQIEILTKLIINPRLPFDRLKNEINYVNNDGDPGSPLYLTKMILKKTVLLFDYRRFLPYFDKAFFNITQELNITDYSFNLHIRFLIYCCFLIERTIRGQSLSYRNLKKYMNEHLLVFSVVKNKLIKIERTLSIEIENSEIAFLVELLLESE